MTHSNELVRTSDVAKLRAVHREIIRLYCLGMEYTEIANQVGLSYHTVWKIINSPLAQQHIQRIQQGRDIAIAEAAEDLRELAPACTQHLREIMEGEAEADIRLKTNVALQILDRVGLGKITKVQSISHILTKDDIEEIKRRAKEGTTTDDNNIEWNDPMDNSTELGNE